MTDAAQIKFENAGVSIRIVDNGQLSENLSKTNYQIIFAIRTLCVFPPTCDYKPCHKRFFADTKTCGGLETSPKSIENFIDSVSTLLAPNGVAVISGQSKVVPSEIKEKGEKHKPVVDTTSLDLLNVFTLYAPKSTYYYNAPHPDSLMTLINIREA